MSEAKHVAAGLITILMSVCVASILWNGSTGYAKEDIGNKLPVVKITAPQNGSTYQWNTSVSYSVVVSDQGKSTKYQEIPSSQVVLQTTYVPDISQAAINSGRKTESDPAGLTDIVRSNCLGCHEFKSAAMGPSFSAVSARYPDTESTVATLSKHIREGCSGIWGQESMPPHPDLTEQELHTISLWIMKHAADPNVNYYVGTEGAFHLGSPEKPGSNAGIILTASYTRNDTGGRPQPASRGEDTIIVHGR